MTGFQDVHDLFGGASYTPGTNYAVAGADRGALPQWRPPGINLPQQVTAYLAHSGGTADPNALYTVFIGGNDVRNAALQGTGPAAITAGVTLSSWRSRRSRTTGARNFLVPNVPNVGIIPEFAQQNPTLAAATTTYSQLDDADLAAGLAALTLLRART